MFDAKSLEIYIGNFVAIIDLMEDQIFRQMQEVEQKTVLAHAKNLVAQFKSYKKVKNVRSKNGTNTI